MTRAKITKAVFPVAGLGTRMLPATKVLPKEMLPIVDRPLIQYAVEEAKAAGIEDFIFVTGRGKSMIEEHFDAQPELIQTLEARGKYDEAARVRESDIDSAHLFTVRQTHPLGLGHAVWCAKKLIGNEAFAVLLPDDLIQADTPCLKQMIDIHAQTGGNVIATMDVAREDTSKYGILDIASDKGRTVTAKGLVEKPAPENAPSTLSVIGRYIIQPEIFDHLENAQTNKGEIQLTDALAKMAAKGTVHGYRFDGQRFDCGSRKGYLEANIAFALQNNILKEESYLKNQAA